jgi:hypothetical protein
MLIFHPYHPLFISSSTRYPELDIAWTGLSALDIPVVRETKDARFCTSCNSRSSSAGYQNRILPGLDFLELMRKKVHILIFLSPSIGFSFFQ